MDIREVMTVIFNLTQETNINGQTGVDYIMRMLLALQKESSNLHNGTPSTDGIMIKMWI